MSFDTTKSPAMFYSGSEYQQAVTNSALWAAAGDAIGWITELAKSGKDIVRRAGCEKVQEPVAWKRKVGGRSGVYADLPEGTYSDDTQLRLCVSRAIRGDGSFDAESFAKVELTSWQGYALGAGLGTKAAASNLSKRGVNWFSNFFSSEQQKFSSAGGNGACMRIQPHVWSAKGSLDDMVLRVLSDAIITHAHPHGFCGAVFHALCLWFTLVNKKVPPVKAASQFIVYMERIPFLLEQSDELSSFWKPYWEKEVGYSLEDAIKQFQSDAHADIEQITKITSVVEPDTYVVILEKLGCLTAKYRGSGFKTSLAALALANIYPPENVSDALAHASNILDSDTDTIATMVGTLLGAVSSQGPKWAIQDDVYIKSEAQRMVKIAHGMQVSSFAYPDLTDWIPSGNQSDTVVINNGQYMLSGIGTLEPIGKEYRYGSSVWQWLKLPFGQTVFAKRRASLSKDLDAPESLSTVPIKEPKQFDSEQNSFPFEETVSRNAETKGTSLPKIGVKSEKNEQGSAFHDIDSAINLIVKSNFDNETLGRMLNQCMELTNSTDKVVGLAAAYAHAKKSRVENFS